MKVCLVGELTGGVGVYGRNLIRGLTALGVELSVLTGAPEANSLETSAAVQAIPVQKYTGRGRWLPQARAFADGVAQLPANVELVHFTDARFALFADKRRLPTVGTMNDYFYAITGWFSGVGSRQLYRDWGARHAYYNLTRVLEGPCLRSLDGVICIAQAVADVLASSYVIPASRLHVVHYGIEWGKAAGPLELGPGPVILFAGGNFQRKGLEVLARASPSILEKFPNARFVVLGSSPDQALMEGVCRSLGVRGAFDFVGQVDYPTLYAYYLRASLFTMPSLLEAFGIPFLEAMHCGVPVVASDSPGPTEYLRHGENCFIAPRGNAIVLAEHIITLLSDSSQRDRLVQGGRRTAEGFTVEKMARQTLSVYRQVLEARRAKRGHSGSEEPRHSENAKERGGRSGSRWHQVDSTK